jgi:glycosyltransferase involved in cell wall biosynthesis
MVVNLYPHVSIITPVYNGSQYLETLIQSVLNQNYPNIEHLIIDDGSQDHGATVAILHKYSHLHWWSRANKGQYATMNEGMLSAQGEIICFVSADDIVSPDAVKTVVQHMQEHPLLDGVFGITNYIDKGGNENPYWIPFRMAPIKYYPYFAHISHCSLYVKKASLQQHGLSFDPALRFVGDYEWIIRIHKAGLRLGVIRRELSKVRIHTDQTSQKNREASVQEARTVLNSQRINPVSYFLLSTLNLVLLRAWKVFRLLKEIGMRGVVAHLRKRNSQL